MFWLMVSVIFASSKLEIFYNLCKFYLGDADGEMEFCFVLNALKFDWSILEVFLDGVFGLEIESPAPEKTDFLWNYI